jgi:hypothetical protein
MRGSNPTPSSLLRQTTHKTTTSVAPGCRHAAQHHVSPLPWWMTARRLGQRRRWLGAAGVQPDAFSISSSRVDVNHVGLPTCSPTPSPRLQATSTSTVLGYQHAAQRPLHTYDTKDDSDGTETAGVQPDAPSPLPGLEDAQDDGVGDSRLSLLRSLAPVILLQP